MHAKAKLIGGRSVTTKVLARGNEGSCLSGINLTEKVIPDAHGVHGIYAKVVAHSWATCEEYNYEPKSSPGGRQEDGGEAGRRGRRGKG